MNPGWLNVEKPRDASALSNGAESTCLDPPTRLAVGLGLESTPVFSANSQGFRVEDLRPVSR